MNLKRNVKRPPTFRITKLSIKAPYKTERLFGTKLPKSSVGSNLGKRFWSGIIPTPNGSWAEKPISVITVSTAISKGV
jgi:hypothetical protein